MVDTGYISFITQTGGGGQDANGNPVSAVKSASDFVPCNLSVVTKEYKSYVDGQYKDAKYSIYIDNVNVPSDVDLKQVKEVQIKDNGEVDLGIHQIHNMEFLKLSPQVKIIV